MTKISLYEAVHVSGDDPRLIDLASEAATSGLNRYATVTSFYRAILDPDNRGILALLGDRFVGVLLRRYGDHFYYDTDSQSVVSLTNVYEIHSGYVLSDASGKGIFNIMFDAQADRSGTRPLVVEPRSIDPGQTHPPYYLENKHCWDGDNPVCAFNDRSLIKPLTVAITVVNHPYGTATVTAADRHGLRQIGINPYDNCPVYARNVIDAS